MTTIEGSEWWWNTGWRGWSIWASPAHYFGRVKTKFQVYPAAAVSNLTLEAWKFERPGRWRFQPLRHS